MSTYTVQHFLIAFAAVGLFAVTSASGLCISCPCGSSGQNITHCFENPVDEQHTCEAWANCQTCAENQSFCASCPPHRFGPACSDEILPSECGRIPPRTNRRPSAKPTYGDYPWTMGIVAISDIDNMFCGGVILDKKTVLTSAQCVTGDQNIQLLFGTARPLVTGYIISEQKRTISRIVLHPDFDNDTKANDLAILKFDTELNFTQTIQPICLPDFNSSDNKLQPWQKGLIPGYGYAYTPYEFFAYEKYQVAHVSVKPDDKCAESCQKQGLSSCSTPKIICADFPKGVDECMYLGSPMVVYDEASERYTLAGLVTRKLTAQERKCRRGEIDTVLTNVSHFMPFILENLS